MFYSPQSNKCNIQQMDTIVAKCLKTRHRVFGVRSKKTANWLNAYEKYEKNTSTEKLHHQKINLECNFRELLTDLEVRSIIVTYYKINTNAEV